MNFKKINIPIYRGVFVICITDDLKKVENKFNLINTDSLDAFTFKIGHNYYMVTTKDLKISVIAHESVHIKNMIFKDSFIKLDINNDEPEAYLLEWVIDQYYKYLNKL